MKEEKEKIKEKEIPPKHCKIVMELKAIDSVNGELYYQCWNCGIVFRKKW